MRLNSVNLGKKHSPAIQNVPQLSWRRWQVFSIMGVTIIPYFMGVIWNLPFIPHHYCPHQYPCHHQAHGPRRPDEVQEGL